MEIYEKHHLKIFACTVLRKKIQIIILSITIQQKYNMELVYISLVNQCFIKIGLFFPDYKWNVLNIVTGTEAEINTTTVRYRNSKNNLIEIDFYLVWHFHYKVRTIKKQEQKKIPLVRIISFYNTKNVHFYIWKSVSFSLVWMKTCFQLTCSGEGFSMNKIFDINIYIFYKKASKLQNKIQRRKG